MTFLEKMAKSKWYTFMLVIWTLFFIVDLYLNHLPWVLFDMILVAYSVIRINSITESDED